jgi:hypothetical protein
MSKKAAEESAHKKIKVQVGVCKRMLKEVASYEKEVLSNEGRLQKMRDEERDIYGICIFAMLEMGAVNWKYDMIL